MWIGKEERWGEVGAMGEAGAKRKKKGGVGRRGGDGRGQVMLVDRRCL